MDFNKIKEMGLEYAEKGKNAALDLAEKGRTQAKIVNAQSKLYKAQRQLGALVYSLAKGNEENWSYNGLCTLEILRSEDFESAYGFHKGGIII